MTETSAFPFIMPIPMSEPTDTWVVETGSPARLAARTSDPVARLAERP